MEYIKFEHIIFSLSISGCLLGRSRHGRLIIHDVLWEIMYGAFDMTGIYKALLSMWPSLGYRAHTSGKAQLQFWSLSVALWPLVPMLAFSFLKICVCVFVFMCTICMSLLEEVRGHQIPWNWSCCQLMWVLVMELRALQGQQVLTPNCWAISSPPAPCSAVQCLQQNHQISPVSPSNLRHLEGAECAFPRSLQAVLRLVVP